MQSEESLPERSARPLWLIAVAAATAVLLLLRHGDLDLGADPDLLLVAQQSVAVVLGTLLALGLAVRSGGRALPAFGLAAVLGAAAVTSQSPTLLGGAALATGVLAACLAVLATRPARSFAQAVVEVLVAHVVAGVGAVGVLGFRVGLDPDRFGYAMLALAMLGTVALVYRLAGGVHALGRGGVVLVGLALLALVVALAYTAALTTWGSPALRADIEAVREWSRGTFGAVPHPIEVLLGIPALIWGVTMRSRRRQGWWVCAFGTTATATAAVRLVEDGATTGSGLGAAYSIVLGLLAGLALLTVVRLAQGTPGRRVDRTPVEGPRPEPGRLQPLH